MQTLRQTIEVAGFEPAISWTRNRRISQLSHTSDATLDGYALTIRPKQTSKKRINCVKTNQSSAQRESNPHFRHGKAVGFRYIMGTDADAELSKKGRQGTGWDSNPRRRITGAGSSPLDDRCGRSPEEMRPEGLEPSPAWLRARGSASRASVPRVCSIDRPGGI